MRLCLKGLLALLLLFTSFTGFSQEKEPDIYAGLKFRNLGPALTSGRIADIAIHPENENIWYRG